MSQGRSNMAFDTSLRDKAVRQAKERREQSRLHVIRATESALSELAAAAGIREVYLFGSVTRPQGFRDESDVDMAVASTVRDPVALAAKLSRRIGREVHIVELDGSLVAERAKREGVLWTTQSS